MMKLLRSGKRELNLIKNPDPIYFQAFTLIIIKQNELNQLFFTYKLQLQ